MGGGRRQAMARKSDPLSDSFGTDDADGWLGGIVADEDDLDRHALLRLGLWGFAAVGAVALGILSGQLPINLQRTQVAANEPVDRARQVETTLQENQLEARRLAAAIETLNSDRDRLFTRLSALEQGLDVITGSIRKAEEKPMPVPWPDVPMPPIIESAPATIAALAPAPPAPPPAAAAPPSEPVPAPTVVAALPEPTVADVPSKPPPVIQAIPIPDPKPAAKEPEEAPAEDTAVEPAEFAIDLGSASSINGLRALWRGVVKSHNAHVDGLRPLIAVSERRNGLGVQLRLIAGPIKDAAAAARICASLSDADTECKIADFDGQRLSTTTEPEPKSAPVRAQSKRKSSRAQPPAAAPPRATEAPSISTLLGFR